MRITTAQSGLEVRYQNGKETSADRKNSQSVVVMEMSERFIYDSRATNAAIAPETPIGHAPMPPSASSWAKNTIDVVVPQITHENTCGFVTPASIERIYGMKATKERAIAVALKINFRVGSTAF